MDFILQKSLNYNFLSFIDEKQMSGYNVSHIDRRVAWILTSIDKPPQLLKIILYFLLNNYFFFFLLQSNEHLQSTDALSKMKNSICSNMLCNSG